MARVRQFANDLGISKNQAQNLINKGRSRKDGGSQILENVMKPVKAKKGKSMSTRKKSNKKINYDMRATRGKLKNLEDFNPDDFIGGRGRVPKIDFPRDYNPDDFIGGRGRAPVMKSSKDYDPDDYIQRSFGGATTLSKEGKKVKKMTKKEDDPMGDRFGKDKDFKVRPKSQEPYHPKYNPDQYHPKLNPKGTKGKPKVQKRKDGGFPDLTGDGNVTKADILKGRGVKGFARGGGMAIQGLGFKGVR